jgi:hypothetical protein
MEQEKFEEIMERLIAIYRKQGDHALFAKLARINKGLADELLHFEISGPAEGNSLTASLFSLGTQPPTLLYSNTKMWVPFVTE